MKLKDLVSRPWFTAIRTALFCHCRGQRSHPRWPVGQASAVILALRGQNSKQLNLTQSFCVCKTLSAARCATADALSTSFSVANLRVMGPLETQPHRAASRSCPGYPKASQKIADANLQLNELGQVLSTFTTEENCFTPASRDSS